MPGRRIILADERVAVVARRYDPGERHAPHTDALSCISYLARGGYREDAAAGNAAMRPGDVLLKSLQAKHEDQFCPDDGALIIAIEFRQDDPFECAPTRWRRRDDGFALRHALAWLEAAAAGDAHTVRAASVDLVASEDDARSDTAPAWLRALRDELNERPLADVDVGARARRAGAHPAHASRLFRRCYGATVTAHAHAQSVRRAAGLLACAGMALSEVALAAGFYDQSHMTRIFRRMTGRTPGACRAALAALAC